MIVVDAGIRVRKLLDEVDDVEEVCEFAGGHRVIVTTLLLLLFLLL